MDFEEIKEALKTEKKIYGYLAGWGAFMIVSKGLSFIDANKVGKYAWSLKRAAVRLGKIALSYAAAKGAKDAMEDIFDRVILYADAIIEAEEHRKNAEDPGRMA